LVGDDVRDRSGLSKSFRPGKVNANHCGANWSERRTPGTSGATCKLRHQTHNTAAILSGILFEE
jgi:hypothetical protein